MSTTIDATFDGNVFCPATAVPLSPNTKVRLTFETLPIQPAEESSFFKTALSIELDGPSDWSANLDKYLYGPEPRSAE